MKKRRFEESIVIFGAGKIGRSFIGQLFSRAGYKIVFIDIDHQIIDELNRRKAYKVIIKNENEEVIEVTNVSGILSNDKEKVIHAINECRLLVSSVGINAINNILPIIARGIEERYTIYPDFPLDFILAENSKDCRKIVRSKLEVLLPNHFPIDLYVGLIETSIGKMVPNVSSDILRKDILLIYAEPYNTLILDKLGFKNPIPDVRGLLPKENIKAWVERKAFIHNLGHVAAAYFGYYKFPNRRYLYEVLADPEVNLFTRQTMKQSAYALSTQYTNEFTENDLDSHIDDLIKRFQNRALGDTIYRVGHDLKRKLNVDDRIGGAIKLAQRTGVPFDKLIEAFVYGVFFNSPNELGIIDEEDKKFTEEFEMNAVKALVDICGYNIQTDIIIIKAILSKYNLLIKNRLLNADY